MDGNGIYVEIFRTAAFVAKSRNSGKEIAKGDRLLSTFAMFSFFCRFFLCFK